MSATYVPTAYYHPTTVLPSPSDWATAASVNEQALKYLTDNDKYFSVELGKFWDGINITLPSGYIYTKTGLITDGSASIGFNADVTQRLSVYGDTFLYQNALVGQDLTVTQGATVGGPLVITGTTETNVLQVNVAATVEELFVNVSIDGPGGVTTIEEDLFISGQVVGNTQFDGNIELAGEINSFGGDDIPINANVQITGSLDVGEPSHIIGRTHILDSANGETIAGADYDFIAQLSYTGSGGSIIHTITNTGAVDGDSFWLVNRSSATVGINITSGFDSTQLADDEYVFYVYFADGGGWRIVCSNAPF